MKTGDQNNRITMSIDESAFTDGVFQAGLKKCIKNRNKCRAAVAAIAADIFGVADLADLVTSYIFGDTKIVQVPKVKNIISMFYYNKIAIFDHDYIFDINHESHNPFDWNIRVSGPKDDLWASWDSVMRFLMYGLEDSFPSEEDQKLFSIVVRKICEWIVK